MEHIVRLIEDDFTHPERFLIEMIGITYPDPQYWVYRPDSPIYCFEQVLKGTGVISCNGQQFTVHAGDVYLLPAHATHDYRSKSNDPMEKIWVNMSGGLCDALYEQYGLTGIMHYPDRNLTHPFHELLDICDQAGNDVPYIEAKAPLLVHEMFSRISPTVVKSHTGNKYAAQAKTYIDRHATERITATDIAKEIGISVSQMNRLFSAQYGEPPMTYYARQRIKAAESLLRNTGMRVREVSRMLGYSDEHYFSNSFTRMTGMSPREYRNTRRKE